MNSFMPNLLRSLVARAPANPDLTVALMLLLAVGMMIMPIPIVVIDMLIGFNLGFAILLLMVALYLNTPVEFSSLPGVILISTVFRLALTVATTRLILAEGDAGSIIHTFGDFVISGNIAVGIVIFLIVTMVQFMVLAKVPNELQRCRRASRLTHCLGSRWPSTRSCATDTSISMKLAVGAPHWSRKANFMEPWTAP